MRSTIALVALGVATAVADVTASGSVGPVKMWALQTFEGECGEAGATQPLPNAFDSRVRQYRSITGAPDSEGCFRIDTDNSANVNCAAGTTFDAPACPTDQEGLRWRPHCFAVLKGGCRVYRDDECKGGFLWLDLNDNTPDKIATLGFQGGDTTIRSFQCEKEPVY